MPYSTNTGALGVASPDNNSSVLENNDYLLGIKLHWCPNAEISVQQTVTLPQGKYKLSWDSYVSQTTAGAESRCGVIIDGQGSYKPLATNIGEWYNPEIEFVATEEKNITIKFGYYKTQNTGGGASPVLLIDNLKLLSLEASTEDLASKISDIENLLVAGSPGESFLTASLNNAKSLLTNESATGFERVLEMDKLDADLTKYQNKTISNIKLDESDFVDFSADKAIYYIVQDEVSLPSSVSAIIDESFGASYQVENIGNEFNITVTAGDGSTLQYVIKFVENKMAAWDAQSKPNDSGWYCTDETVNWAEPGSGNDYQFRDNLALGGISIGRAFIHPHNNALFSFPVTLEEGKIYAFECSSAKMSGDGTRPVTFTINTAQDGSGDVLGSDDTPSAKWDQYTNHYFEFLSSEAAQYFATWQTQDGGGSDRSLAYGFKVYEIADAIKIEFETFGGTEIANKYIRNGEVITLGDAPIKENHNLLGWYTDADFQNEFDAQSPITADTKLYAKWESSIPSSIEDVESQSLYLISVKGGVKVVSKAATQIRVISIIGQDLAKSDIKSEE